MCVLPGVCRRHARRSLAAGLSWEYPRRCKGAPPKVHSVETDLFPESVLFSPFDGTQDVQEKAPTPNVVLVLGQRSLRGEIFVLKIPLLFRTMIRREITSLGFAEARAWLLLCFAVLVTISFSMSPLFEILSRLLSRPLWGISINIQERPSFISCLPFVGDFRNCNLSPYIFLFSLHQSLHWPDRGTGTFTGVTARKRYGERGSTVPYQPNGRERVKENGKIIQKNHCTEERISTSC